MPAPASLHITSHHPPRYIHSSLCLSLELELIDIDIRTLFFSSDKMFQNARTQCFRSVRTLSRRAFTTSPKHNADHVRLVEVGPRDGLQNEKTAIAVDTKIELVRRLAKTGLSTIEAGSFVSPKWVPQV